MIGKKNTNKNKKHKENVKDSQRRGKKTQKSYMCSQGACAWGPASIKRGILSKHSSKLVCTIDKSLSSKTELPQDSYKSS